MIFLVMRCSFLSAGRVICSRNVACSGCIGCIWYVLRGAVFFEPRQHSLPSILGRLLVVSGPVIRVETVTRIRIYDDLRRTAGLLQRLPHLLDLRPDARRPLSYERGQLRHSGRAVCQSVEAIDHAGKDRLLAVAEGIAAKTYPLYAYEHALARSGASLSISRFIAFLRTQTDAWRKAGFIPMRDVR